MHKNEQIIEGHLDDPAGQGTPGCIAYMPNDAKEGDYPEPLQDGDIVYIFASNTAMTANKPPLVKGVYVSSKHEGFDALIDMGAEITYDYRWLRPFIANEMPVRIARRAGAQPGRQNG